MRIDIPSLFLGFTLLLASGAAADPPPAFLPATPVPGEGIVGEWAGELDVRSMNLRLALHVEAGEDGNPTAALDSLDQGAKIPVERIEVEEKAVKLALPAIGGAYEGEMNADGSAIDGTWSQGGRTFPLVFHRTAEAVALFRPQEPKPPFPYTTRDVTFPNQTAGLELAGTFVVPEGEGPFPAVVFVSGSGAQDRDEQLMGHRPFLVIADHLARHGVASLRFDDRGFGESEGDHMGSTVADFATDVEAALAFLVAQPEVDRGGVGILGHSEGGVTGPLAAVGHGEVDFLVLLAPPGVPLDRLLARQTADILRLRGVGDALIERSLRNQAEELELVKDAALDARQLAEKLHQRFAKSREEYSEEERAALGVDEIAIEQAIQLTATPWFRSLMRVDPGTYLSEIEVPVLALFGEKDVQVAAEENAAALRSALAEANNGDGDVRVLPGLNHLFQNATTGAIEEYGKIEETLSPEVLRMIADWIQERFAEG